MALPDTGATQPSVVEDYDQAGGLKEKAGVISWFRIDLPLKFKCEFADRKTSGKATFGQ